MLQRKLTLVTILRAFALASVSWLMWTGAAPGSEKCLIAPNAPPPRDEHWYYRTDRATNQQCWYLAPLDKAVQKRVTEKPRPSRPQLPQTAPPSPPSPDRMALDGTVDAGNTEADVPMREPAINGPEPAKLPDELRPFESEAPRPTDLVRPAARRSRGPADQLHATTAPSKTTIKTEGPPLVFVITFALMALFGATYHIVHWILRRKVRNRWNIEWSNWAALNESHGRTGAGLNEDSRKQISETLQQLLNELQTKLNETPDPATPVTERTFDDNRISATSHAPRVGLPVASY
ncbi:MAG TPA: hypothetical protein VJR71_04770 [Pseudolabrys sp.]|nr:hypothetical protein [Pseudolabrys sp.]